MGKKILLIVGNETVIEALRIVIKKTDLLFRSYEIDIKDVPNAER